MQKDDLHVSSNAQATTTTKIKQTNIQTKQQHQKLRKKSQNNKYILKNLGIFLTYNRINWNRKGKQIKASKKKKIVKLHLSENCAQSLLIYTTLETYSFISDNGNTHYIFI